MLLVGHDNLKSNYIFGRVVKCFCLNKKRTLRQARFRRVAGQTEPELGRRRYTTYRVAVVTVVVVGRVDVGRVEVQVVPVGAIVGAAIPVVTVVASVVQVMIVGVDVTTTNKIQTRIVFLPKANTGPAYSRDSAEATTHITILVVMISKFTLHHLSRSRGSSNLAKQGEFPYPKRGSAAAGVPRAFGSSPWTVSSFNPNGKLRSKATPSTVLF